jgi:hypothetical protein
MRYDPFTFTTTAGRTRLRPFPDPTGGAAKQINYSGTSERATVTVRKSYFLQESGETPPLPGAISCGSNVCP